MDQLIQELHTLPVASNTMEAMMILLRKLPNGTYPSGVVMRNIHANDVLNPGGRLIGDVAFDIRNTSGSYPDTVITTDGEKKNPMFMPLSSNNCAWGCRPVGDYVMNVVLLNISMREAVNNSKAPV